MRPLRMLLRGDSLPRCDAPPWEKGRQRWPALGVRIKLLDRMTRRLR